jgi:tRNA(fMet)-specific endonuclease VapC
MRQRRRTFLDDLKATVPIYPLTESTAEITARTGAEQAAKGINLPLGDLMIGACALELGYAVGTGNARDFNRIPGLQVISL